MKSLPIFIVFIAACAVCSAYYPVLPSYTVQSSNGSPSGYSSISTSNAPSTDISSTGASFSSPNSNNIPNLNNIPSSSNLDDSISSVDSSAIPKNFIEPNHPFGLPATNRQPIVNVGSDYTAPSAGQVGRAKVLPSYTVQPSNGPSGYSSISASNAPLTDISSTGGSSSSPNSYNIPNFNNIPSSGNLGDSISSLNSYAIPKNFINSNHPFGLPATNRQPVFNVGSDYTAPSAHQVSRKRVLPSYSPQPSNGSPEYSSITASNIPPTDTLSIGASASSPNSYGIPNLKNIPSSRNLGNSINSVVTKNNFNYYNDLPSTNTQPNVNVAPDNSASSADQVDRTQGVPSNTIQTGASSSSGNSYDLPIFDSLAFSRNLSDLIRSLTSISIPNLFRTPYSRRFLPFSDRHSLFNLASGYRAPSEDYNTRGLAIVSVGSPDGLQSSYGFPFEYPTGASSRLRNLYNLPILNSFASSRNFSDLIRSLNAFSRPNLFSFPFLRRAIPSTERQPLFNLAFGYVAPSADSNTVGLGSYSFTPFSFGQESNSRSPTGTPSSSPNVNTLPDLNKFPSSRNVEGSIAPLNSLTVPNTVGASNSQDTLTSSNTPSLFNVASGYSGPSTDYNQLGSDRIIPSDRVQTSYSPLNYGPESNRRLWKGALSNSRNLYKVPNINSSPSSRNVDDSIRSTKAFAVPNSFSGSNSQNTLSSSNTQSLFNAASSSSVPSTDYNQLWRKNPSTEGQIGNANTGSVNGQLNTRKPFSFSDSYKPWY